MSDTRNPEILKKLQNYLETAGEGSQTKLANAIGYNTSSGINQYLKGTYPSVKALEAKLSEYFAISDTAAHQLPQAEYVPTSISEAVYQTIRNCHLKGGLAIECGDAGIGKTKSAQKYVADYPNSAVLITINPCFSSITSFLKLLCRAIHVSEGRKDDMWLNCAGRLVGKKILIIDESQHLPLKTIELIRAFADYVPGLGIIFIGNRGTVDSMGGRLEAAFAQINSRLKLKKIRFTSHIKKDDIEKLFPILKSKKMAAETDYLLGIAQSQQGIRGATNLWSNANDNNNVTYKGLVAMSKFMEMTI